MIFTPAVKQKTNKIFSQYPVKRAAALPVMHLIQETYGSISQEAELEIADYFQIPPADVRELMTFYTLYSRQTLYLRRGDKSRRRMRDYFFNIFFGRA